MTRGEARRPPQEFDRVLSSMCTTPHPAAREAAQAFLATNPGDPETYPAVAERERDAVALLGEIVGLSSPHGYIAAGGTEANLQAVRAARNRADADAVNVVAPASAHFSFQKAADVLGVELRLAPTDGDHRADVAAVADLVDGDTAVVVGVAGTTEYGRVDPIPALADIAAGVDANLHVDAAWGGFVLPFTDHDWSFADAPVNTMAIDPHKMGQAPVPAGGFLARDPETLDALAIETPYLESDTQPTLGGTRSGAGVAGALASLRALWPDGYREQYERTQGNAEYLAAELAARGYDVVDPELPLVAADMPDAEFQALREEGWRISRTASDALRVVCMPHVTREMLAAFLDDVDALA
ncbi:tyrosine decarboxylase MfnA [Halobacterium salinarum]|uniref:Probable L-aspartate decarboxylase n=5 Tax=Halobacterium salinarum TaxID=2242 RepID=MFNA_HALSA|nr:tyrosine decarboxylase MfnA [Halobacterium salinarum]B0R349.1 RecName: Full=Probable L-aspartate decarboxylase; Short=ADC [Halobacterium salinarum R1]Q9HSA3.1 RecName: Full=Probable L-aspartate decarboxylase; Short=ADC [Halobacterium salinarum NRC-1]AAG18904.1 glutamate decarboxylase [Halobacterium salinarum NRC-1]MBB6090746.1 tyrosine decarboxylase/aspartate 1-decarboxylase [Halobacterium salinarum]MDL0124113.1 tyrosine decarboxylase MfnA [Halobacterium salinarum]MDL0129378.1 tyrosine dec